MGHFIKLPLTLFFLAAPAAAEDGSFDSTMSTYIAKMAISLVILAVAGVLILKFLPGRLRSSADGRLKHIGTLPLGRDAVHVVQTGPEVIAVLVSRSGATVMGRWPLDEWHDRPLSPSGDESEDTDPRRVPR